VNEHQASTPRQVQAFESAGGARIFQLPLKEFPMLWGQAYLVLLDDPDHGQLRVLIDSGSGFGDSNRHLEAGFEAVSESLGQSISLQDLTHIFITHAHIDHFGGLKYVRPRTAALLGVHELDLRNLTQYEERLAIVARRLSEFLVEAGVDEEQRLHLLDVYRITKSMYGSVRVDFTYEAAGMRVGPFEMLHVPGHCAGHVVIRLHDVLFAGDHVLADTSPHQSPEHLTNFTGLEHYLKSLDALQAWAGGIRLTLGGHENPILDLPARIEAIRLLHRQRLYQVQQLLTEPQTIAGLSHALFGEVHGYNVLLALEETGAHVEYLYQRGLLEIANMQDLENGREPVALRYRQVPAIQTAV
jgi:glyoxylase-like metal-dependent hydrolase (beta-lactamase superfamily II)